MTLLNHRKSTEQDFPVMLFVTLYQVVLTIKSVKVLTIKSEPGGV